MSERAEALRLALWHEERAREVEREARTALSAEAKASGWFVPSDGEWLQLEKIREYHEATAKTLRSLAALLPLDSIPTLSGGGA